MPKFFYTVLTLVFMVLCTALLTGCGGGDKYIIKGLSLPSGSTVVKEDDSTSAANKGLASLGSHGQVDAAIAVMFDNEKDWNAVSSHIGGCLSGAGLKESSEMLGNMGGMGLPGKVMDMLSGTVKIWVGTEEGYVVELVNNAGFRKMSGGISMPGLANSDYTLVVVKGNMGAGGAPMAMPTGM